MQPRPGIARSRTLAWLALTVSLRATGADPPAPDSGAGLADDLQVTLAWHGIGCREIVELTTNSSTDHAIACVEGTRYRVEAANGEEIRIRRIIERIVGTSVDLVLATLRTPARILGFDSGNPEHVADVAKRLFAIVTLAGHDCGEVLAVERRASDDHLVTCRDGIVYHVHSRAPGLHAVQAIQLPVR